MMSATSSTTSAGERSEPSSPRWPFAALLISVAIASAFVWWLIRSAAEPVDGLAGASATTTQQRTPATTVPPTTTTTAPSAVAAGEFTFDSAAPADSGTDCAEVSYGQVAGWFAENPCERVVRTLYTAGRQEARALVSVIVVTMPDAELASALKGITDTSGTGNVSDMIRDGTAEVTDAPKLAGGAYASAVTGADVTIVEAEFFDGYQNSGLLTEIATEALQVATHLR